MNDERDESVSEQEAEYYSRLPFAGSNPYDLISDEELADAMDEAKKILSGSTQQYNYRSDHKGGPRNVPEDQLRNASFELQATRIVLEEMVDRHDEARLIFYETIAAMLEQGVPVDFIARHSGLNHRPSVYRVVNKLLPALRSRIDEMNKVSDTINQKLPG